MSFSPIRSFNAPGHNFFGSSHGTISHKDGNWAVWHKSSIPQPLSTPEPGSLLLLSTGLAGLAGTVRRKLKI